MLANRIEAEPVKVQWLKCLLRTGAKQHVTRLAPFHQPFAILPISLVDSTTNVRLHVAPSTSNMMVGEEGVARGIRWGDAIHVHVGDDLKLLAGFVSYLYAFGEEGQEAVHHFLTSNLPEYASSMWIETRQSQCLKAANRQEEEEEKQQEQQQEQSTYDVTKDLRDYDNSCQVVIGMTTCKRIDLFMATATSLLEFLQEAYDNPTKKKQKNNNSLVCRIIVVDDGSSIEDVYTMKQAFPHFEYVMKPTHFKGHAESMNLLLEMVTGASYMQQGKHPKLPYFLYVEDDWLFLEKSPSTLYDAYHLLQLSNKRPHHHQAEPPLLQVLFNSQGSRLCAYADVQCSLQDLYGSGWKREIEVSDGDGGRKKIEYMKHEFGTAEGHAFSYWPGFSLNPGLWDLNLLLSKQDGKFRFNSTDMRFEQSISLKLAMLGFRTAHFPKQVVKHIGVETSAYELNGARRAWDRKTTS
jgi:hypothetical protein